MSVADTSMVVKLLQGVLGPSLNEIKASESHLSQLENQAAGSLLTEILNIMFNDGHPVPVRQSGAIFCKNLLKRRWQASSDESLQFTPLDEPTKESVRGVLLAATCGAAAKPLPRPIQLQVNAIISYIADIDFPKHWPNLLPSLVSTLNSSPSNELRLNALTCLCSVFRKYRTASRSTEILLELKYLLPLFQETHLTLFTSVLPSILASSTAPVAKEVFAAMEQLLEIFYSLNVIDIPEYYQDNISSWMSGFLQLLSAPTAAAGGSDEPSPLDTVKTLVCENLSLYADKYQEVFEPFVIDSVKAVWSLLVNLDCNEARFDLLVSAGIGFLSSAAATRWSQSPFADIEALKQICEKLVLPNIQLRDVDVELFLDNPDDYMRKDLQNADAETRRRSAVDLVKSLCKFYENDVTAILLEYIGKLLSSPEFTQNPRAKDACIHLVTAVAVKGETRAGGVSQINPKVDIHQFLASTILPQLRLASTSPAQKDDASVLTASCLKFVVLFRSQLPVATLADLLPLSISLVNPKSAKVVQCYAAHCAFLLLSIEGLPAAAVSAQACSTIDSGIDIIASTGEQNEYLIKLIFRLLQTSPVVPPTSIQKLLVVVDNFSSNPVNAVFTHYLFESLGVGVGKSLTNHPAQDVAGRVVPPLCQLLDKNVMEYIPYALQILSLLIESGTSQNAVFSHLLTLMLNEQLWRNQTLVPGIVRIMTAYLRRSDLYPFSGEQMLVLAVRFGLLAGTVKFEGAAFELANDVASTTSTPPEVLQPMFMTILTKLHAKKSARLIHSLSIFLSCLVATGKLDQTTRVLDTIQPGLSTQVLKDLWISNVGVTGNLKERKVLMLGIAALLGSAGIVSNHAFINSVVVAVSHLLTPPAVDSAAAHSGTAGESGNADHSGEFEVAYAKLSSTSNPKYESDFLPQVSGDGTIQLKTALKQLPHDVLRSAPALVVNWISTA